MTDKEQDPKAVHPTWIGTTPQERTARTVRGRMAARASFAARRIERARQEIIEAEAIIKEWKEWEAQQ